MASQFYGALNDVEVVTPLGPSLDAVHDAYVTLASTATCTDDQRQGFFDAGRSMVEEQGADAVLLAGTDLAIAFHGFDARLPGLRLRRRPRPGNLREGAPAEPGCLNSGSGR